MEFFRTIVLSSLGIASVVIAFFFIHGVPIVQDTPKHESPVTVVVNPDYFPKAYDVILKHEGGYSNDPDDKGKATKYGISLSFLEAEKLDIDGDGDVDIDDIKAITSSKSKDIYYNVFWKRNQYDKIEKEDVAIKIMDTSVNVGSSRCHKILKNSLNEIMLDRIKVDGIMDDETIEIINLIEPSLLLNEFRKEQADFYQSLINKTPKYKKYRTGWMNRAKS